MLIFQVCQSAAADCNKKVVDLVFVLPSHDSVGSSGWSNIINFVTQIVDGLNVDGGLARVGIMRLVRITDSFPFVYAVVTTTIRLRFDGRSTAYQRSLRSQRRNTGRGPASGSRAELFIYLGLGSTAHTHVGPMAVKYGRCTVNLQPNRSRIVAVTTALDLTQIIS